MKRSFLIIFLVLTTLSLSACIQQKLSFDEVDNVPKKVTEAIKVNGESMALPMIIIK